MFTQKWIRKTQRNKGQESKTIGEYVIESLIVFASIVVSLIVAIVSITGKFDAFETITTTMLSFLCTEYISHAIIEKTKYFKAKREYQFIEQTNELTGKLYEMNEYCKTILQNSHGAQDLFAVTCKKSVEQLYYILQTAALDKRLEIASDYLIESEGVFEALNASNERIVELTFPIEDLTNGILTTPEDRQFFETAYKMVIDGHVEKIKVLLILGSTVKSNDPKLAPLYQFYNTTDGFEAKIISKDDFVKACKSNMISSTRLDFGIYGIRMLFTVESYEPYKGVYTKNASEIERYHKLFCGIWNFASMVHEIPQKAGSQASPTEKITVQKLFDSLNTAT